MMLTSNLKHVMQWWGSGLLKGLPSSLRRLVRSERPRVVLQLHQQALEAFWKPDQKLIPLGTYSLNAPIDLFSKPPKIIKGKKYLIEVQLPTKQGLLLEQRFPEAIQENLRQVIGYQLDRLSPFSPERAYYSAEPLTHDRKTKEINVNVQVIPKHSADRIIQQLKELGIPEVHLLSVTGSASAAPVGQMSATDLNQGWSWVPLGFMVTALVLSLAAPIAYQYRRVEQIETALAQVRQHSAEQLQVREQLNAAQEAMSFLTERRRTSPVALDVAEHLSQLLPNHTWLERLTLEGNALSIKGESSAALDLIDLLEGSPMLSQVKFKAPVTRSKDSNNDKFQIQAQVEVKS
ncbi:MAG: PilN domain-containing protein [Thiofilum sp.]|uniref:PilN domain-containing protein n=1 Tax=Thiofilum sp. TaxID=2212733 RepID=UPI0025CC568F|nr:PilN domain-containing protein [Thiofilum sp.]MBK8452453.1 PilN domain-containing protein [Thiofilum sp.]